MGTKSIMLLINGDIVLVLAVLSCTTGHVNLGAFMFVLSFFMHLVVIVEPD